MYPAFIYLSIFLFLLYFYFILFNSFFLLECLWSAKILSIESQLGSTKPHLLGQFIFHQEPVLDQTMTNLQQNTIGLKFLDFNRICFKNDLSKLSYSLMTLSLITRGAK